MAIMMGMTMGTIKILTMLTTGDNDGATADDDDDYDSGDGDEDVDAAIRCLALTTCDDSLQ